jgi:hypothetical protein
MAARILLLLPRLAGNETIIVIPSTSVLYMHTSAPGMQPGLQRSGNITSSITTAPAGRCVLPAVLHVLLAPAGTD